MALAEFRYWSAALQKQTAAIVLVPERADWTGPYPVLYLLHGLGADYSDLLRMTAIERHVKELPLIVVMPDGGRSWYVDAVEGPAYDAAIAGDLIHVIDRTFPTDARREARAVGGFSMGGTGALTLAFSHPDLFCSATSHAGWWGPGAVESREISENPESQRISGRHTSWKDNPTNPYVLMERARHSGKAPLPALHFDCGTGDTNLAENRQFHAYLESIGIEHDYVEHAGSHNYEYVDARLPEALAFHARILGLNRRM